MRMDCPPGPAGNHRCQVDRAKRIGGLRPRVNRANRLPQHGEVCRQLVKDGVGTSRDKHKPRKQSLLRLQVSISDSAGSFHWLIATATRFHALTDVEDHNASDFDIAARCRRHAVSPLRPGDRQSDQGNRQHPQQQYQNVTQSMLAATLLDRLEDKLNR